MRLGDYTTYELRALIEWTGARAASPRVAELHQALTGERRERREIARKDAERVRSGVIKVRS